MIQPAINPRELKRRVKTAASAGLRYVSDAMPGVKREGTEKSFRYRYPTGALVKDTAVLKRIKSLAIPPAWTDVWICPDPCGHLQATGRDAKGRKQNRYHPDWRGVRDANKYAKMVSFGKALPGIRRAVERDLRDPELSRRKVLATVVKLLEVSFIRVGNQEYARNNKSFGLTTMRDKHVAVKGSKLIFHFRGKSGKLHDLSIEDRRLARIVKRCQDLPGQELFQYVAEDGTQGAISSEDVNEYLKEISGQDFTAKDFRTWAGTVLAAGELWHQPPGATKREVKRNLVAAVQAVASRLGNTPAVCKKCYIHPYVLGAFSDGRFMESLRVSADTRARKCQLRPEEVALLRFLEKRAALEKREQANPAAPFAATLAELRRKRGKRPGSA